MSNSSYDDLIKNIKTQAETASSEKDWDKLFQTLKAYAKNEPLGYSFTFHWIVALIFALISVGMFLSLTTSSSDQDKMIAASPFLITLGLIFYITSKKGNVSDIADLIFYKDVLWDNGLKEIEVDPEEKYEELEEQFGDFSRGDEDWTIESWIQGKFKGDTYEFNYHLYDFRYIEVTYQTITTGKTTTTRRVETPYHRYGMIVDFPYCSDFAINSDGCNGSFKNEWKTSSHDFNKRYDCQADSEQDIAKFLTPSTTVLLTDFNTMSNVNWELTNGKLCVSFDEELVNLSREHGLEDVFKFEAEIKKKNHLSDINELAKTVHKIMTNSDNNFSRRK